MKVASSKPKRMECHQPLGFLSLSSPYLPQTSMCSCLPLNLGPSLFGRARDPPLMPGFGTGGERVKVNVARHKNVTGLGETLIIRRVYCPDLLLPPESLFHESQISMRNALSYPRRFLCGHPSPHFTFRWHSRTCRAGCKIVDSAVIGL